MKSIKSILPALAAVFALSMAAPALAQTAQPSAMAPAAQPSAMAPAASSAMAPKTTKTTKTVKTKTTKAKVASFKSEAAAKESCPMDTVVWGSSRSKAYHVASSKLYGKTKTGAYMCEKAATAGGFHAAKN